MQNPICVFFDVMISMIQTLLLFPNLTWYRNYLKNYAPTSMKLAPLNFVQL